MGICRRNAAKDTIDLINRQRAEIEDLKETLSIFREDMHLIVDRRRHEAIKEFAERLENKLGQMFLVKHKCVVEAIDNLVKEMVGEG